MNVKIGLNTKAAMKHLNNVQDAVKNLPWSDVSKIVLDSIQMNFDLEGRYGREKGGGGSNKWKQRTKEYPHPILTKTGTLRSSIGSEEIKGGIKIKSSGVQYAQFHQFGTKKMSERPFVVLQDTDIHNISVIFDKHIQQAAKKFVPDNPK